LFPQFAEAIRDKLNKPQCGELLFDNVHIVGFLDCKIDKTCTPGAGSLNNKDLAPGRLAAEVIQRALYSGYLNRHGLKVFTVVFPNGIIAYFYGPVSARENDIGLLSMSWLNDHMAALQPEIAAARANGEVILYFYLYGDKIFPYLQFITHAHDAPIGGQLPPCQRLEVLAMNCLQTSVEWPYGDFTVLFHIMHSKQEIRLTYWIDEYNPTSTVSHHILHLQLLCLFQW
jgi:hypothetical protein